MILFKICWILIFSRFCQKIRHLLGGLIVKSRSCIPFSFRHAVDSINVVTTTFEVLLKTHGQQMEIAKEVSILPCCVFHSFDSWKGFSVQCDLGYYLARVFSWCFVRCRCLFFSMPLFVGDWTHRWLCSFLDGMFGSTHSRGRLLMKWRGERSRLSLL